MACDELAWKSADCQHTMMELFNLHITYIGSPVDFVKLEQVSF